MEGLKSRQARVGSDEVLHIHPFNWLQDSIFHSLPLFGMKFQELAGCGRSCLSFQFKSCQKHGGGRKFERKAPIDGRDIYMIGISVYYRQNQWCVCTVNFWLSYKFPPLYFLNVSNSARVLCPMSYFLFLLFGQLSWKKRNTRESVWFLKTIFSF